MHKRAMQVKLHPAIEQACLMELGKQCTVQGDNVEGEVVLCIEYLC